RVISTSIQSLMQSVAPRAELAGQTRRLAVGQSLDVDAFLKWLVTQGFHGTSAVELPGEFSARGGIVDIFAPDWDQPVRVELFGDEIESIRQLDVATQRSLHRVDHIDVTVLKPNSGPRADLAVYLAPQSWVLLIEPERLMREAREYVERLENPQSLFSPSAVMESLAPLAVASAAQLSTGTFGAQSHVQVESVERFEGDLDHVRQQLDFVASDQEVFLVAPTEGEIQRIGEILRTTRLASRGALHYVVGHLSSGFRLTRERALILSGSELFHRGELRRTTRRHLGKAID